MKKVLFIATLVTLASCSSETSTSSKDSACWILVSRFEIASSQAAFLAAIVYYLKPQNIIELGTSFGVTTSYLASSNEEIPVYTLEGNEEIGLRAKTMFSRLGLSQIHTVVGEIDDTEHAVRISEEIGYPVMIKASFSSECPTSPNNGAVVNLSMSTFEFTLSFSNSLTTAMPMGIAKPINRAVM